MFNITLINARVGLTSVNQDHVIRNHSMNMNPEHIDVLFNAQLGNTGKVSPSELMDISSKTGGLSMTAEQNAFIQEGWGVSRGLAVLEFIVESNAMNERKIAVSGYITGGSVTPEGIPEDAMFVPNRTYEIVTSQFQNHQGFLSAQTQVKNASQLLLNDNTSFEGLAMIRPKDIIENTLAHQAQSAQDLVLGGGDDNSFQGSANSILKQSGIGYSKVSNNSPTHYAQELIESSMSTASSMQRNNDPYAALAGLSGTLSHNELIHNQNPFIATMRNALGHTSGIMAGFEGYYFSDINYVFNNFPDVVNLVTTDTSRYTIDDHRLHSNEFGTSSMTEVLATELVMLSQFLLTDNNLSMLTIDGTNAAHQGGMDFNGMNVDYFPGQLMPLVDGLDVDYIGTIERIKIQITNFFFNKFCSQYDFQKQYISFHAEFVLFGESTVTVTLNSDDSTSATRTYATYALNRFDPNVTSPTTARNQSSAFYQNLQNHFNLI